METFDIISGCKSLIRSRILDSVQDRAPRNICLLDPPAQENVGDSAILLGEMNFFNSEFEFERMYFYDWRNFKSSAEKYIDKSDIIFIHGGGNFGDIWPNHHNIRKAVIKNFRHKKIIQLPQSIHFSSNDELQNTKFLIGNHPDFTLLVRDKRSFEFARKEFDCTVTLVPDMAFYMDPIKASAPTCDVFSLLRTDKEAIADHRRIQSELKALGVSAISGDWLSRSKSAEAYLNRVATKFGRAFSNINWSFAAQIFQLRMAYARQRVQFGIDLLAQGEIIVTDRLHAMILSFLLGRPVLAFDSFDGKISAFQNAWLASSCNVGIVESASELVERVKMCKTRL